MKRRFLKIATTTILLGVAALGVSDALVRNPSLLFAHQQKLDGMTIYSAEAPATGLEARIREAHAIIVEGMSYANLIDSGTAEGWTLARMTAWHRSQLGETVSEDAEPQSDF